MDMIAISELITVNPLPVASFTTNQTGLQIEFMNSSLEADQYFWFFGDGGNSMEVNPIHHYSEFGTYPVMLITTNECGSDTMAVSLELSGAPVPGFAAIATNGCVPFEVQFIDMSQNGPELWAWSFPGGNPDTSNLQNPVIVYEQPGEYPVTLRVTNAGGSQVLVRDDYIRVAVPPVAAFSASVDGGEVTFMNQSEDASTYLWSFGDGDFDTNSNPVHVYMANGTYQVQLIAVNACSSDTVMHEVTVMITAIEQPESPIAIELFPNPNEGKFIVRIDPLEEYDVSVYDALGRHMFSTVLYPVASGRHELNMRGAEPGVYSVVFWKAHFRFAIRMILVQ
jgi:PKD repeat protein